VCIFSSLLLVSVVTGAFTNQKSCFSTLPYRVFSGKELIKREQEKVHILLVLFWVLCVSPEPYRNFHVRPGFHSCAKQEIRTARINTFTRVSCCQVLVICDVTLPALHVLVVPFEPFQCTPTYCITKSERLCYYYIYWDLWHV